MTQIATLPNLVVALGVGRSDWRDPTGQTLIDITQYVRTIRTTSGKQHELDRHETGTLIFEVENRGGHFTPFDTNAKSYPLVGGGNTSIAPSAISQPMTYLSVTATWSGTTYNVFQGYISTWSLVTPDELNSDVMIQAEDAMKVLSTSRIENTTLYPSVISSLSGVWSLVRCGDKKTNIAGGLAYDGAAYPASILGSVNTGAAGAHVYDPSTAIDLSNGSQAASGSLTFTDINPTNLTTSDYYVEAWFKGAQIGDFLLSNYRPNNWQITGIGVDSTGRIRLQRRTLTSGSPTDATLSAPHIGPDVTDGNWHLIGLQSVGGTISMFCDGYPIGSYADSTQRVRTLSVGAWINGTTTIPVGTYGTTAIVADVLVIGGYGTSVSDQTLLVMDRYRVGSLMQTTNYADQLSTVTTASGSATFDGAGFVAGQTVNISGCTPTGYNGSYLVTSATGTTFTVTNATTGALTVAGVASLASPKTTGYTVLEAMEAHGLIPAVPAPGLSSTSSTAVNYSIDKGTANVGADTSSAITRTPAEVCLTASDTELGAFFWSHNNARFEFHDRFWCSRNLAAGTLVTISDQSGTVVRYLGDVEMIKDDLDLWTQVTISDITSANWPLQASTVNTYGQRTLTRSTYSDGQITAEGTGNTILYRHKQPVIRVGKVELTSVTGSLSMTTQLTLGLGDAVRFERRDSSTLVYSQPLVVESISHDFTAEPGRWNTVYVLSPFEITGAPYLTTDGTAPNVLGGNFTLSAALTSGTPTTVISIQAAESGIHPSAYLKLTSGTHTQTIRLSTYTSTAGATSLTVVSFTPNYSYPIGTALTGVTLPLGG